MVNIGRSSGLPHLEHLPVFYYSGLSFKIFPFCNGRFYSYGDSSRFTRDSLLIPINVIGNHIRCKCRDLFLSEIDLCKSVKPACRQAGPFHRREIKKIALRFYQIFAEENKKSVKPACRQAGPFHPRRILSSKLVYMNSLSLYQ